MTHYRSLFTTSFGTGLVLATNRGICRVVLPSETPLPGEEPPTGASSPLTEAAAQMLQAYFDGERCDFSVLSVDLSAVTEFRSRILTLIRRIPYGQVRSYGEIAMLAGVPSGARAIGGAMASNPVPIVIPCHRVVAANGRLTGFTAPGGVVVKKRLLMMEGVEFKGEEIAPGKGFFTQSLPTKNFS